jgi:hypothetical protein
MPGRGEQIRRAGYPDAAALVDDVAQNFTEVWEGKDGTIMLVRRPSNEAGAKAHTI